MGWGWDPNPFLGELGVLGHLTAERFCEGRGDGGRSSCRCEKGEKMPRLAPFILLATFLTHDNNFHLYLSRECEKRALHHRARVPRGCRISRPGGLGPHLQGRPELSGAGTASLPGQLRSPSPAWPWGESEPRTGGKWGCSTSKMQEAGGMKVGTLLVRGATLTSQQPGQKGSGCRPVGPASTLLLLLRLWRGFQR